MKKESSVKGRIRLAAQVICAGCGCYMEILPAAECDTKRDIIKCIRSDGWRKVDIKGWRGWQCSLCASQADKQKGKRAAKNHEVPF